MRHPFQAHWRSQLAFDLFARSYRYFGIHAVPGYSGRAADTHLSYLPELTGLRGIAIIMVVCGHFLQRVERFDGAAASLGGLARLFFAVSATPFSGCCIFFCISGHSLMTFLHRKRRSLDRDAITAYGRRRISRLCPPYFVVLLASWAFLHWSGYVPAGTNQFFVAPSSLATSLMVSLVFCHDLAFGTFPRLFPPGWFLETQFQFYVIGPTIWILYSRLKPVGPRLLVGLGLLAVFSIGAMAVEDVGPHRIQYSILAFLPFFWLGALLADLRAHWRDDLLGPVTLGGGLVGWLALAVFIILGDQTFHPEWQLVARLLCLSVVFATSFHNGGSLHRLLVSRWMARLGIASYSIYLVHLQVLQILTPLLMRLYGGTSLVPLIAVCAVGGIVGVGVVSVVFYWLVERPCVVATGQIGRGAARVV